MTRLKGREAQTADGARRTQQTWFSRVARLFSQSHLDESVWDMLEESLLGADVGYDLTEELIGSLRRRVQEERLEDGQAVKTALKKEMVQLLQGGPPTEVNGYPGSGSGPRVILVVGVNGSGKTTSIAKLGRLLQEEGKTVLLAAADTFRPAAIDQLKVWGDRLNTEVIAHAPGADPGAVVYDALQAARSRRRDVVLIDTAGRLHTKTNLMEEMKKVHRVIDRALPGSIPEVLLVLDATTGQNGLAQAREFTRAVPVDGVLLAKLDGTAKGGVIFAIRRHLGIPVTFIGTGEGLNDLAPFESDVFVDTLFSQP